MKPQIIAVVFNTHRMANMWLHSDVAIGPETVVQQNPPSVSYAGGAVVLRAVIISTVHDFQQLQGVPFAAFIEHESFWLPREAYAEWRHIKCMRLIP